MAAPIPDIGVGTLAMTMADRDGLIWLDGAMVPWRQAKVHVLTYTLHYKHGGFRAAPGLGDGAGYGHLSAGRAHRVAVPCSVDSITQFHV